MVHAVSFQVGVICYRGKGLKKGIQQDKRNRSLFAPGEPGRRRHPGEMKKQRGGEGNCQTINSDWDDKYNTEDLKGTSECRIKQRVSKNVCVAAPALQRRERREREVQVAVAVSARTHTCACSA